MACCASTERVGDERPRTPRDRIRLSSMDVARSPRLAAALGMVAPLVEATPRTMAVHTGAAITRRYSRLGTLYAHAPEPDV